MATKIKVGGSGGAKPEPAPRLVVELPDMMEKRASVRFNAMVADPDISTIYLMRKGWERLGSPEGVRITIEPLT